MRHLRSNAHVVDKRDLLIDKDALDVVNSNDPHAIIIEAPLTALAAYR